MSDYLELADWRRRIASLYAQVRDQAATDPRAAFQHWRMTREQLFRTHPQSPLPIERRAAFQARYFPYDPALRFEAPVQPSPPTPLPTAGEGSRGDSASVVTQEVEVPVPTSGGGMVSLRRVGVVEVPFPDGARRLTLFWMGGYGDGIFLSFRDGTNGADTYGGGRYLLDAAKSADLGGGPERDTLILDFNFAYHPSCAWDPRWVCPLVAPDNRLDIPIQAGEQLS